MDARHRSLCRSIAAGLLAVMVAGGAALPCRGADRAARAPAHWLTESGAKEAPASPAGGNAAPEAAPVVQVMPAPPPKNRLDATEQPAVGRAPEAIERWADDAEAGVATPSRPVPLARVEPDSLSDEPTGEPDVERANGEPDLPVENAVPADDTPAAAAEQATPWAMPAGSSPTHAVSPASLVGAGDSSGVLADEATRIDTVGAPRTAVAAPGDVMFSFGAPSAAPGPLGSVVRAQAAAEPEAPPPPRLMPLPSESPFQPEATEPGAAPPSVTPPPGTPAATNGQPQTLGTQQQQTQQQQQQQADASTRLQFLRQQSVLLKPGEYQWDITFQYLIDETDFAAVQIVNNQLFIGQARRRQRLLLVPIEFRLGLWEDTQAFVNVPFGWSNNEFNFRGQSDFSDFGGIGDVSAGVTRVLIEESDCCPTVLATVGFAAPTGQASLADALSAPGSTLGEGFWSLTTGITCIRTYDPVVLFYGFGYRHRFQNVFDPDITVNPGKQIFYRLGVGFAVNPRVTFSSAFIGSYITDDFVNNTRIEGSTEEPLQLRLALTVAKPHKGSRNSVETLEPFVTFGLTDAAANAVIGLSWTR